MKIEIENIIKELERQKSLSMINFLQARTEGNKFTALGRTEGFDFCIKKLNEVLKIFISPLLLDSFLCALSDESRCKEQCFTCSEDQKCDKQHTKNLR